jgi:hypothetical protein
LHKKTCYPGSEDNRLCLGTRLYFWAAFGSAFSFFTLASLYLTALADPPRVAGLAALGAGPETSAGAAAGAGGAGFAGPLGLAFTSAGGGGGAFSLLTGTFFLGAAGACAGAGDTDFLLFCAIPLMLEASRTSKINFFIVEVLDGLFSIIVPN